MRILQIGSALHDWGGIERYLVYLGGALAERGHEVWATVPPGSPLDERLADVQKVHLSLKGQFRFDALPRYVRFLRRHRFDVVNAHFSPDYIVPALAAKLAKQPCRILTRHVVLPWSASKVKRYTGLFTHFVGVSDAVAKVLVESGVPAERVRSVHAGVPDLEPLRPREDVRRELGIAGFAIGFFGRIVDDKGVDTLVEAARSLPPNTVHVFGDGPERSRLESLGGGVRFHGRIADVADAMAAMDAVAVPSKWDEAFPYSALEAMSLGKPVLATRSGGLPEQVVDGETGFLFPKGDALALASLTQRLMDDPALSARLGEAGRARQRAEFTIPKFGERMESAYRWASGQET